MIIPKSNSISIKNNYGFVPSFGSIERTVFDNSKKGYNILYRNTTCLFREDINWNILLNQIIKSETPKKIYCYACSDGSEPYSLAMALISKLGYEKAKQYFPIVSRDIDLPMINRAKSGSISINVTDLKKIKKFQNKSDIDFLNVPIDTVNSIYDDYKTRIQISDKLKNCVDFVL